MSAPKIRRAKSISSVVCEHGSLYVRLHDAEGRIFACAVMDRGIAAAFLSGATDQLLGQVEADACAGHA